MKATPLAVCTAIYKSVGESMSFEALAEMFFPGYRGWSMGWHRAHVAFCSLEVDEKIIRFHGSVPVKFDNYSVSGCYRLTAAGRHIAMTSITGKSARETLLEIEEEMAGQA